MAQGKYSDGKTLHVVAPAGGVVAGQFYRISGWNGIAMNTVAAGETFALEVDATHFFYVTIPGALAGALGDVLYMPLAGGGATLLVATAAGNAAALKVTKAKDAGNVVGARLLNVS